jgi:hypothetical protein
MYMNIWHGGVWANFHKANLILYFSNQNIFWSLKKILLKRAHG